MSESGTRRIGPRFLRPTHRLRTERAPRSSGATARLKAELQPGPPAARGALPGAALSDVLLFYSWQCKQQRNTSSQGYKEARRPAG